jgi:hypothetical protein
MPLLPTSNPETWAPAGTERIDLTAIEVETRPARKPVVVLPTEQPRRRAWTVAIRAQLAELRWVALEGALPWSWFLIRDLGPAMQLVSIALPVLVAAALIGLVIAALDDRKVGPILVALSVAAFGFVTVLGPRSALPSPPPVDPISVASVSLGGTTMEPDAVARALAAMQADVAVVTEASRKTTASLLHADGYRYTLDAGPFVVVSRVPVRQLHLPTGLPARFVARFQVDRADGAFVLYAVRTKGTVLDAAMNDPLRVDRLRTAALAEHLPVVLAGDFGIGDRSTPYRTLQGTFRDALRSGADAESTLRSAIWRPLLLRVDYVFTSKLWCAADAGAVDLEGAAHAGVSAAVGPCRR